MGLTQWLIGSVNDHPTYAFDTQYAYVYISATGWTRSGAAEWHGSDLNYFWAANWQSVEGDTVLFVTNFNNAAVNPIVTAVNDPIWYLRIVAGLDVWTAATGPLAFFFRPNGGAVHTGPFC